MMTDKEIRDRAEELYVINGLTLEAVAEETGVAIWTIKRWSSDGKWKAKQKEYRNAEAQIRRYTRLARLNFIKDAISSLDPQKIYAFAALERATHGQESESVDAEAYNQVEIKTPQDAIEALEQAISIKINLMLSKPDVLNFSGIKDMKQAMDLVKQMKAEYGAEPEKEVLKGNDEEQARFWRERVLGVK